MTPYGYSTILRRLSGSGSHLRYDFSICPGSPFLNLWENKIERYFKSEATTLQNFAGIGVVLRGYSSNREECTVTVFIGLFVGTQPGIGTVRCRQMVQRLQIYLDREAPGVMVEMEEVPHFFGGTRFWEVGGIVGFWHY
ncbi:MAG: hypothetical protein MMC33_006439 [Icmadophila ericetorum]|nr:hypothetical protein [Icmadophila ericetorum]